MIRKHREPHGRASTLELEKFLKNSSLQMIVHQNEVAEAVAKLRATNAERRLQDQRDLDADYRNYIIPV